MPRPLPLPRAIALTAIASLFLASAAADERAVPVRIEYRTEAGCHDPAAFVDRLLSRSSSIRVASGKGTTSLVVRVTRGARGTHGRLTLEDPDGSSSVRDVDGDSCESVLDALALMAALALDPAAIAEKSGGASPGTLPDAGSSPSTQTPPDAGASPDARLSVGDAGSPSPNPPASPLADETPQRRGLPPLDVRDGWHLSLGAGVALESGLAPAPLAGLPVFLEIARSRASAWSPSLQLGFEHADSGDASVSGGGARFVWNVGTLDLCPLRWVVGTVRLTPCLRAEGGLLDASGLGVTPARSETDGWLATGAVLRARYVPFAPFFVDLTGGVRVLVIGERFFFEPDTTAFQPPSIQGFAGGAVGVTIL